MKKIITIILMYGTINFVYSQVHAPRYNGVQKKGIYPEASIRVIKYKDLSELTDWDIKIMKSEIYARHGYIFKNKELMNYFSNQPWYQPISSKITEIKLSDIEKENIRFLEKFEQKCEYAGLDFMFSYSLYTNQ